MELLKKNIEAEMAIIAALLNEPADVIISAQADLKKEYFYNLTNATIFDAIIDMNKKGIAIDVITVIDYLEDKKLINEKSGIKRSILKDYNEYYNKYHVSSAHFEEYIEIVFDSYTKREFQKVLSQAQRDETSEVDLYFENIKNIFESYDRKISSLGKIIPSMEKRLNHGLYEAVIEKPKDYIKTPFVILNENLNGGLHRKRFFCLTAPAGGGKTTFVLQILDYIAKEKIPCLFVCLEMSIEEILIRSLSRMAEINSGDIEKKEYIEKGIKSEMMKKLTIAVNKYAQEIAKYMIIWEADRDLTTTMIFNEAKKIMNKYGKENGKELSNIVIAIDPLHALSTGNKYIDQNPFEKAGMLGGDLKRLSRQLNCPVIGISDTTKEAARLIQKGQSSGGTSTRGSYEIQHRSDISAELISGKENFFNTIINDDSIYKKSFTSDQKREILKELGDNKHCEFAMLNLTKQRSGAKRPCFFYYYKDRHEFKPIDELERKE